MNNLYYTVGAIAALIAAGAFISIKRVSKNRQSNINITGDKNKVTGRDDKSSNK